jgi:hypothetical protein
VHLGRNAAMASRAELLEPYARSSFTRCPLTESRGSLQLEPTPEQQEEIRRVTGRLTDTLELTIEEFEERTRNVQV